MSGFSQDAVTESSLATVEDLLSLYQITDDDLKHIRVYGEVIIPRLDEYVDQFYTWLKTQPEFDEFFSSPEKLATVQQRQLEYWTDFFRAEISEQYVEKRRAVGEAHARIGLSLQRYFSAWNMSQAILVEKMYDGNINKDEYCAATLAISKLMNFDKYIVVDTYSRLTEKKIRMQSQALFEMSTPVMTLWDEILLLPIVGTVDSARAQNIMEETLGKLAETGARTVILDILGVPTVDSAVAAHLLKVARATRLMGCDCILSGLSPNIAQTLVQLGVELGDLATTSTVQSALALAFDARGFEVRAKRSTSRHKEA